MKSQVLAKRNLFYVQSIAAVLLSGLLSARSASAQTSQGVANCVSANLTEIMVGVDVMNLKVLRREESPCENREACLEPNKETWVKIPQVTEEKQKRFLYIAGLAYAAKKEIYLCYKAQGGSYEVSQIYATSRAAK